MDPLATAIRFFQEGGPFMYPIVVVLALGVAITIERWIYLGRVRARNRKIWDQILPLLHQGRFPQALELASTSESTIGRMLAYGLARVGRGRRADDLETAMEESLMEIVPRLERRTQYIAIFANIATLLGLLGTILGLISAFTAVANADPTQKAALLSTSISVAMNTTAFGLMTAIPLLLAHAVIQSRTHEIIDSLEMAAVKLVNIVRGAPPAAEPPAGTEAPAQA
ncbi:MotA/TolQ/ExbB proton channel family protein [Inmirania thermothiophila]|uniref:Outer membrane transport energization protein ExbB n=1 Tax=Inmirania thermothiophila TaxID=1750597 RepID=A0A3N1XS70_9GAMM|nr:MotA/TolQ/ExbB proton channel family protein [Inmirania thermothiophila]ROR29500.1 outer membrane transport energization protein ExbB [Inmirania thermothiophila]